MRSFPETSATMMAKIRNLGPEQDAAEWARFWDTYAPAIRRFAVLKGGEAYADDIVMQVLEKLVAVLREGQYVPEKGAFHSYLATMIVNEVHMLHRYETARAAGRSISIDHARDFGDENESGPLDAALSVEGESPEVLDETWRQAVLASAVEHVLTKTALSARDRAIYREYVLERRDIGEVSQKYGVSRNNTSQICSRIEKRIVAFGRELVAHEG